MFTVYSADVTSSTGNCSYPHKHVILDEDSLKAAINRRLCLRRISQTATVMATTSSAATVCRWTAITTTRKSCRLDDTRKMMQAFPR